jgi:RNA polymerase-binding transcription factor DksA
MTQEKISEYKMKLEGERRIITGEIKKNESLVDFGTNIDVEDDSDQVEEMGNQLAVAEDLKRRLDDVEVALEKIDNGKYGICERCAKPIEEEILDIDPESRLCKNCKLKA